VVFMLDRAGIVGEDGATHQGLFDISYLRAMPNLVFMAPKDENELQHMLYTALQLSQPVAIRYPRGAGIGVPLDSTCRTIPLGTAEILRPGNQAALFAVGNTTHPALDAAQRLAEDNISCAVINSRFIKPLDEATLLSFAGQVPVLVTVEENMLQGGFGSAVLETLQQHALPTRVIRIGIPDVFVEQGTQKQLRAKYGLDADGIAATVKKCIGKGQSDSAGHKKTAAG